MSAMEAAGSEAEETEINAEYWYLMKRSVVYYDSALSDVFIIFSIYIIN